MLSVESSTAYYMQYGHSYLPNDTDFGIVEKSKKLGKEMYISQAAAIHSCGNPLIRPFTDCKTVDKSEKNIRWIYSQVAKHTGNLLH